MRRTTCGSCHSADLQEALYLGDSPLADEFPKSLDEVPNQKRYPLGLVRCNFCSLLQLTEVVSDEELWGGDYGFYTGSSWVAVQQQRQYAEELLAEYPDQSSRLVVEIACNDGSMLTRFKEAGCRTVGVDPAAGPAAKAQGSGLDVWAVGFSAQVAESMVAEYGHASLVVANNVIAHVADLDDFVRGLGLLLAVDGRLVVEFQYAGDLIAGNMIDHVYHEHRSFFSLTSLSHSLARHGLKPLRVLETSPQGGSLRVHIGRIDQIEEPSVHRLLAAEAWLRSPDSVSGMQGRADRIKARLLGLLEQLNDSGKLVAGFGASAKSTTLLNFCGIGPDLVQYIVDTTPTKHGRYSPGTGIPIIDSRADSRAPDVYCLFVWNYAGAVMRKENFPGRWLIPIPLPVLL
jgi:SAM-dependent methyltransferase